MSVPEGWLKYLKACRIHLVNGISGILDYEGSRILGILAENCLSRDTFQK